MSVASGLTAGLVRCPACFNMLAGPWEQGAEAPHPCSRCQTDLRITAFPALASAQPLLSGAGTRAEEGEATCFFHPEKRAERACDRCGRFVCTLCDLPVGARHLCPNCLQGGQQEKALPELITRRVSYGQLSLMLSLMPLFPLVSAFFIFTAPAAVFFALWGWNKPGSLVHGKRRVSLLLGLFLGLLQIAGLVFFFYQGWLNATTRGS